MKVDNAGKKNEQKFRDLTFSMDIPKDRREPTDTNLRWFLRNGFVTNQSHKNFQDAVSLAMRILNERQ